MIPNPNKDRFVVLDSLRGLAALGVALSHYTYLYDKYFGLNYDYPDFNILGASGVELFFILSGFVIFYSINKTLDAKQFLLKRAIRLYPTYWVCLISTFTIVKVGGLEGGLEVKFTDALLGLSMFQQLIGIPPVDRSYWTLIPELFFYLSMAGLILLGLIKQLRYLGILWIVLSYIHIEIYHIRFLGLFLNLDYMYFFYSGILLFFIKTNKRDYLSWIQLFICILLISINSGSQLMITTLTIYGLYILFIFNKLDFLNLKPLIFLGQISYAWYLIHQNVGYVIMNAMKPYIQNNFIIITPLVITAFMAYLITKYFEKPAISYLRRKVN